MSLCVVCCASLCSLCAQSSAVTSLVEMTAVHPDLAERALEERKGDVSEAAILLMDTDRRAALESAMQAEAREAVSRDHSA